MKVFAAQAMVLERAQMLTYHALKVR